MRKYLTIFVIALLALSSCGKMLDEIAPKGAITTDKLSESDITLLSNGVMHQFEAIVSNLWFEGDFLAENYAPGPGFNFSDTHAETQSASSPTALSRWTYCYGKLQYANLLIQAAKSGKSAEAKDALGVGYFFRAYIYFNLVTRYGGVPIIETPTNLDYTVSRADEAGTWKFIQDDLDRADACFAEAGTVFRSYAYVSPEAVALLRAKVCLWLGDYTKAVSEADKVIGSPAFSLSADSSEWAKMFVGGTTSRELVFAPVNIRSTDYIRLFEKVNDTDGSFNYSPAPALYSGLYADNGIKTGDIRKAATFGDDATRVIKFPNGQGGQFIANPAPSESPLPVFRLADAYFIKAEAQWLGGGTPLLAMLTLKTFMDTRYASVNLPAVMTGDEFEALLLDELQREFYSEGRKWFDIKRLAIRRHGYVSATNYSSGDFTTWIKNMYPGNDGYTINGWNDRHFLMYWPIPQAERDKSYGALTQNPGYAGYN